VSRALETALRESIRRSSRGTTSTRLKKWATPDCADTLIEE
jgi:hypothetical protein